MDLGYHELFPYYGYLIDKVPNNILEELKPPIDNLQSNFLQGLKHNDKLVGEIEHEYTFSFSPQLTDYVEIIMKKFEEKSNYLSKGLNLKPANLNTLGWINFQKKYEYNPRHTHGGLLSFVIWYKIPYSIEDEQNYSPVKKNIISTNGTFVFTYPSSNFPVLDEVILPIDKTKEGHIVIFPSSLSHTVYPFYTSNEYRITIAGNIEEPY
jgi:hypothetical protein